MGYVNLWREDETEFLTKHHAEMTANEIGKVIGRSPMAVRNKAESLGLEIKRADMYDTHIILNEKDWTQANETLLRGTYDFLPLTTIAKRMGKSVESLEMKVKELGLVKKPHERPKTETMPIPKCFEGLIFGGSGGN